MRIVILGDPLDNQKAGIHYYTRNLVMHLGIIDEKHEYYIIRRKKDELFPSDRQIIIKNYSFPGYAALRMFCIIPWKIRQLKADIVVEPAHFGPFNLPRRIKRVTVIHDLTPIMFPYLHRFHSQLLQRIFLKGILRKAALIITNSKNTSKDVEAFLPAASNKIVSIYLGKDEDIKKTNELPELGYGNVGKEYFLFTGTIEPRKNLECLLDAFELFKKSSSAPHRLIICGQIGWKSKPFFKKLASHPNLEDIILPGFVKREKMSALYSHALAFIFPSLYEGFGLPVVEAMSCGTACILSNTSSLPEVGGDAALYFDANKPEELADLLEKISSDSALGRELSAKALKQAEKFNWETHAEKFDEAVNKILR